MTERDAKDLVRRYVESVWNRGDLQALDALTTEDFSYHIGMQPSRNRAAMTEFIETTRSAFPDWHVKIAQIIAEGDSVAVRWEGTATHKGSFHRIPPTGKSVRVAGINTYRIASGRIAEEWEQTDSLGLLRQLGVLPPA